MLPEARLRAEESRRVLALETRFFVAASPLLRMTTAWQPYL